MVETPSQDFLDILVNFSYWLFFVFSAPFRKCPRSSLPPRLFIFVASCTWTTWSFLRNARHFRKQLIWNLGLSSSDRFSLRFRSHCGLSNNRLPTRFRVQHVSEYILVLRLHYNQRTNAGKHIPRLEMSVVFAGRERCGSFVVSECALLFSSDRHVILAMWPTLYEKKNLTVFPTASFNNLVWRRRRSLWNPVLLSKRFSDNCVQIYVCVCVA